MSSKTKHKHQRYNKLFLTKIKRAVTDFKMLDDGDKVAVGISGGKDSIALLYILLLLQKWSKTKFELFPITVDLGFGTDYTPIKEFCNREQLPYTIVSTQIGEIVFGVRQENNPCSLCAKLRRGALHEAAVELGCQKVALGHHADDLLETFFLNLCYSGRLATFNPMIHLDKTNLWLIRPLIYLHEETLASLVKLEHLPVVKNLCPVSGITKREDMKEITAFIEERCPEIKERFVTALMRKDNIDLW